MSFNHARHVLMFSAWLAALKALASPAP